MIEIKPIDSLTTLRECALKLLEEASEACEAIKTHDKVDVWETYKDALYELADVEQCVCNCLHVLNARMSDFEIAVNDMHEHNKKRGRNDVSGTRTMGITWNF